MALATSDKSSSGPPVPGPRPVPPPPGAPRPTPAGGGFSGLRVSLMPSDLEGGRGPDLRRQLLVLALVLIMETLIVGGIHFWLSDTTAKRQAERVSLDQRINDIKADIEEQNQALVGAVDLDKQVKAVKSSLEQHVYWTEFFAFLESNARPNVRFLRFGGEAETGLFSVDVMGRSYRDIAEQIVALRDNPKVLNVRATSASAKVGANGEIEGVLTAMMVRVDASVWSRPSAQPAP